MLAVYEAMMYLGARVVLLGVLAPCLVALLLVTAAGAAFDFFHFLGRRGSLF